MMCQFLLYKEVSQPYVHTYPSLLGLPPPDPSGSSQSTELSSLSCAARSHQLFVSHLVGCTDPVLWVTQEHSRPRFTAEPQHLVVGMRKLDRAQQISGTFRFLPLCSGWVILLTESILLTLQIFFFFAIISSTVIPPICFFNCIFQFYSYTWVSFYFFCHCWNVLTLLSVSRVLGITFEVFFWWVL